jgi:hypothetical protein
MSGGRFAAGCVGSAAAHTPTTNCAAKARQQLDIYVRVVMICVVMGFPGLVGSFELRYTLPQARGGASMDRPG